MEKINKIKEFVKEHDNGWVADWDDKSQRKHYVFFHYFYCRWEVGIDINSGVPWVIYMSENCAESLVRKLNSGEIIL
jgi:actin-related protein